ncbi:alpha-tectorin-like [Pseudophryne corroboree]|uniref:alpha-tectorin-like n=1 Tax=Pseudophryne corroboree TaxID=495146 RepID=UPI0030816070
MKTWNCLTLLLLALPSALSYAYTHPGSLMYPYGPAYNDLLSEVEDDGGEKFSMSHSFKFFGEIYREVYINNNGAISFGAPMTEYTPDAFPIKDANMICPFWADVDNEQFGDIMYRETTDTVLLKQMSDDMNKYFVELNYVASWAMVVTWHEVAYHGTESNKTNTFQCVLMSDSLQRCLVVFNYHEIQWITGTASGGDPMTGLGGTPAQAGFNTEHEYFNMPMSRTDHIINIKSTSNVNCPGRWVFRVDHFQVPNGCLYKDSFMQHGETMWTEDTCNQKCACRFDGKVHCEEKPCDEGQVCLPAGRNFLCQINEEDC